MKITRTLLAAVAALSVFASTPALAQETPQGTRGDVRQMANREGRGGGGHLAKLAQRLNLTEAQKQQLQPILQDFRAQQMARRESHRARFEALLTPEQRTQLEQFQAQRKQAGADKTRRQQGQKGEGGGPFQQLGLTEAQKTQMQALREQARTENQAAFQALVAQVNPVLTEAQRTQLQQLLEERGRHKGPKSHS